MPARALILALLCLGQPEAEPLEQDDPTESAQKAYNEGTVHYSAGLYDDAVASFKQAMLAAAGIEDRSYRDAVLRALHFNLARALYGRFKVSREVGDLRQAREVLANYLRDIEVHGAERKEAKALIDQLDAELELKYPLILR